MDLTRTTFGTALTLAWLCALVPGAIVARAQPVPALVARGHEPSWRLTIGPDGLDLQSLTPELAFRSAEVVRATVDGKPRLTAVAGDRRIAVTITERLCADIATGMPFPVGVEVELDGEPLRGCGGEIMDAIAGGWRVIRLEDAPLPAGVTITMEFGRDGTVSGGGGCNRYTGPYTLNAEGLAFGNLASTRMACEPIFMDAEMRFLALAQSVTRATPGDGGQLRLMAGAQPVLVLDRAR